MPFARQRAVSTTSTMHSSSYASRRERSSSPNRIDSRSPRFSKRAQAWARLAARPESATGDGLPRRVTNAVRYPEKDSGRNGEICLDISAHSNANNCICGWKAERPGSSRGGGENGSGGDSRRQRIQVDRHRAIGERALEREPDQAVRPRGDALLRERRPQHVSSFAPGSGHGGTGRGDEPEQQREPLSDRLHREFTCAGPGGSGGREHEEEAVVLRASGDRPGSKVCRSLEEAA